MKFENHRDRRIVKVALIGAVAAFVVASQAADAPIAAGARNELAALRYGTWGFDLAGRDTTVKPGDDFFRYSQGLAIDKIVIPPDRSSYGNYQALEDLSQRQIHAIVQDAAAMRASTSTRDGKIGAFYLAFMNEERVEELGVAPIKSDLAEVSAAKSRRDLAVLMGQANRGAMSSIFTLSVKVAN